MARIKVYLIARISEDAHLWNNKICSFLDKERFEVFNPQEHNPWNKKHESFSDKVFQTDLDAIKNSDMGLLLPEYGKDCAWECGWYSNSTKPCVAFVDTQFEWLRDWMVKGGIDYVVTNNQESFKILNQDPILKLREIKLISDFADIGNALNDIYEKYLEQSK